MAGLSKKLDPLSKKLHPIGVDLPTEVGGFSLAIFGICGPCEDIAEDIAIISVMQQASLVWRAIAEQSIFLRPSLQLPLPFHHVGALSNHPKERTRTVAGYRDGLPCPRWLLVDEIARPQGLSTSPTPWTAFSSADRNFS
jgi:hypothetical protein